MVLLCYLGEHNSVKSRIRIKNECCFIAGCSCHLAHLAAGRGGKGYTSISGFDIEEHQVDLHYYFKNSTRRKGILAEYMDFVGLEWEECARFVTTRCCYK